MKASNYKTVRSKSRKRSVDKVYTGKGFYCDWVLEKVIKSPSLRNLRNRVVTNDRYAHITPKFTQKIKELTGGNQFL